ncbi:MAG TPA: ATP-binding protein [Nitrososphaeraceae archaeon]
MIIIDAIFDNLGGKFLARLREIASSTRTTADGKATITFKTAKIEANYSPEVIKNVEAGRLIAIPNVMGVGTNDTYSIYEVADIYPMHYSMLTLDKNQPGAIRKEFMMLIEREWQRGSKSTWIEIIAAPTGYIMQIANIDQKNEPKFIRKNVAPLAGSEVYLLSKEAIQKFICYTPILQTGEIVKTISSISSSTYILEPFTIGSLFGITEQQIPFVVNIEKLLYYHVGAFAFTGAGKSNLTSLIIRKAMNSVSNIKFVIFDVSSEYGINILDLLRSLPSRVILTDELHANSITGKAEDYFKRHVCPDALAAKSDMLLVSIEEIIGQGKIRRLDISSDSEQIMQQFSTYGGLLRALAELTSEKYGAAGQKVIIPTIANMIKKFMVEKKLDEDSPMNSQILPLIRSILDLLAKAKLKSDATLLSIFNNLQLAVQNAIFSTKGTDGRVGEEGGEEVYNITKIVNEIMDDREDSPKLFVINLPEADEARYICADIIGRAFKKRKSSFTLIPKVVFVFDEAQEFIPYEKRKEDGTDSSSRAVERLLRHGRKYHLHGWISTQRIANLNTNALQQLHSYFVSTMPRPYDRQLISDTFAIDDAFVDRTLMFQNGDWLMTSFKATNTQNVPVFFHAINNEDSILD